MLLGDVGPVAEAVEVAPGGQKEIVRVNVAPSSGKDAPAEVLVQQPDEKSSAKTEEPRRLVSLPSFFISSPRVGLALFAAYMEEIVVQPGVENMKGYICVLSGRQTGVGRKTDTKRRTRIAVRAPRRRKSGSPTRRAKTGRKKEKLRKTRNGKGVKTGRRRSGTEAADPAAENALGVSAAGVARGEGPHWVSWMPGMLHATEMPHSVTARFGVSFPCSIS